MDNFEIHAYRSKETGEWCFRITFQRCDEKEIQLGWADLRTLLAGAGPQNIISTLAYLARLHE